MTGFTPRRSTIQFNAPLKLELLLGQRFRLGGRFSQNVGWHFFHRDSKFEHRCLGAAPPPRHFPVRPNELHIAMGTQSSNIGDSSA